MNAISERCPERICTDYFSSQRRSYYLPAKCYRVACIYSAHDRERLPLGLPEPGPTWTSRMGLTYNFLRVDQATPYASPRLEKFPTVRLPSDLLFGRSMNLTRQITGNRCARVLRPTSHALNSANRFIKSKTPGPMAQPVYLYSLSSFANLVIANGL